MANLRQKERRGIRPDHPGSVALLNLTNKPHSISELQIRYLFSNLGKLCTDFRHGDLRMSTLGHLSVDWHEHFPL